MNGRTRALCFKDAAAVDLGKANEQHWFLVTGVPDQRCAAAGNRAAVLYYVPPDVS